MSVQLQEGVRPTDNSEGASMTLTLRLSLSDLLRHKLRHWLQFSKPYQITKIYCEHILLLAVSTFQHSETKIDVIGHQLWPSIHDALQHCLCQRDLSSLSLHYIHKHVFSIISLMSSCHSHVSFCSVPGNALHHCDVTIWVLIYIAKKMYSHFQKGVCELAW